MNIIKWIVVGGCVAASYFLNKNDKDGWGWFLFAAIVIGCN